MLLPIWNILVNIVLRGTDVGIDFAQFIKDSLVRTAEVVQYALKLLIIGLFGGLIVQKFWQTGGELILNITSLISLAVGLWACVRLAALVQLCVHGNEALKEISKTVSGETVKFPDLLKEVEGQSIIRWSAMLLLAISGAASFANIFPVYKDITAFLGCVVLSSFCLIMYNTFVTVSRWKIAERTLMFAFIMLLIKTAGFVIPANVQQEFHDTITHKSTIGVEKHQDDRQLKQTERATNHGALTAEQRIIQKLGNDRNALLTKMATNGSLSDEDRDELDNINSRLQEVAAGELTQTKHHGNLASGLLLGPTGSIALFLGAVFILCLPFVVGGKEKEKKESGHA